MRPGLLSGEYTDFGKWDQCLAVDHQLQDFTFRGKYCVYELHWQLPASKELQKALISNFTGAWIQNLIVDADAFKFQQISNSICIPFDCTPEEIEETSHVCTFAVRAICCLVFWGIGSLVVW